MDDSGVHLDRDASQFCQSVIDTPYGSQSVGAERCDDSRYEVSCDSSLDIRCWEQPAFWTPTPKVKRAKYHRRSSVSDVVPNGIYAIRTMFLTVSQGTNSGHMMIEFQSVVGKCKQDTMHSVG
ncbi:hypothetical protein LSH36_23g06027 [Paralvinella palmiformis]|uniref:Uncharacterized protein n=1 Tax=Paralvinella palmiformis TaxID=53620 RepID=A0AAD9NHZ2_9ANNE|nr:hypothetical protein LSH36_23g06027 [Paralvinella palmiformis]